MPWWDEIGNKIPERKKGKGGYETRGAVTSSNPRHQALMRIIGLPEPIWDILWLATSEVWPPVEER